MNADLPADAFGTLPLTAQLLANLTALGYHSMTPIQARSLPVILDRRDLIAQAKTGSGKTAAFGIGILQRLNPTWFAVQSLVVCPTRELADQVANELRRLARFADNIKVLTLCGGAPMRPQIASLEHGAHIVVGTPGRLRDHLGRGSIDLSTVQTLVLDEADRMVDMGFYEDIAGIVAACPLRRQTLLFSATYPADIRRISASFMRDPTEISVESQHDDSDIEQRFYMIDEAHRYDVVAGILEAVRPVSTLAFCNTKLRCRELAEALCARGYSALALHGDLEQRERDEILVRFVNTSCSVLVATDVAARGLDITHLNAVINVDISRDTEVHVHRVGRTGRGADRGLAITLCTANEKKWAALIESYQNKPLTWSEAPLPNTAGGTTLLAPMATLCIMGGKKDKVRPADVLGAMTNAAIGLRKDQIGTINVFEFMTYVAVDQAVAKQVSIALGHGQIKGRSFKVRLVDDLPSHR